MGLKINERKKTGIKLLRFLCADLFRMKNKRNLLVVRAKKTIFMKFLIMTKKYRNKTKYVDEKGPPQTTGLEIKIGLNLKPTRGTLTP